MGEGVCQNTILTTKNLFDKMVHKALHRGAGGGAQKCPKICPHDPKVEYTIYMRRHFVPLEPFRAPSSCNSRLKIPLLYFLNTKTNKHDPRIYKYSSYNAKLLFYYRLYQETGEKKRVKPKNRPLIKEYTIQPQYTWYGSIAYTTWSENIAWILNLSSYKYITNFGDQLTRKQDSQTRLAK